MLDDQQDGDFVPPEEVDNIRTITQQRNLRQTETIQNVDVWSSKWLGAIPWSDVTTLHLERIVNGIKRGKSFGGQEHKLERAEAELATRTDRTPS